MEQQSSIIDCKKLEICTDGEACGYVPTVGRWGSEWPSWLEHNLTTQFRLLSTDSINKNDQLIESKICDHNAKHVLGQNETRWKWAELDGYNMAAFDQIEGAWPIDHPLPLPAWSNDIKDAVVIDKVIFNIRLNLQICNIINIII